MKARAIALVLAAGALAALLLVPAGAGAAGGATKPKPRFSPASIDQEIGEQGSNGFRIRVSVHDRRGLELSAFKLGRGLSFESATYKMPFRSPPGSDEIKARFGDLGRVDMRFHPETVKEGNPEPGCSGGKIVEEEGFWIGLLAFHGESGYTQVRVRSALGTVTRVPPLRCRPKKETPANLKKLRRALEALEKQEAREKKEVEESAAEEKPAPPALELLATSRNHHVAFAATRAAFGKGKKRSSIANLDVTGTRRRGKIEETGSVLDLFAPGSYFRPTDPIEPTVEGILKPRLPFSGSATYRSSPKGGRSTLSGDLSVELPGFGSVPLAGHGIRAATCEPDKLPRCTRGLGGKDFSLRLPW